MVALTSLQAHVLNHLERVVAFPYKLDIPFPLCRHQLDGKDCSAQITSLVVRGYVREEKDGSLTKTYKKV